jgi:hypothetical protein
MSVRDVVVPALLLLTIVAATAESQILDPQGQAELARRVLYGTRNDQGAVVGAVRQIGPERVTPELRAALITALDREGYLLASRLRKEIPYFENGELVAWLAQLVAAFRDPRAIVALAGALGSSPPAIHALAEFGEAAAPAVLQVVERTPSISVEDDALLTLRFMAEGIGGTLSDGTRSRMRRVAKARLTERQESIVTVWMAIDLAVALNDSELRRIVQSLASDRNAVIALRSTDAELVDRTQRRAAARLAGTPASPRHESSAEFAKRWR